MGHSYRTLLWDTLKGHSCETLLWDTVAGHSCGTLLWDTLVGHSCRDTVCPHTRSSHASVSYETSSKSHASRLQDERFVRDFLQKSHVESPKRAFRTRLPPKVTLRGCKTSVSYETSSKSHTRQVSKTSVSHETSSKSHTSSLQNERFVRDFLQKSSGNTHRSTHITQPCLAISRFQPLQTTPAHTPIPM